ncbi:hypothetical protein EDD76_101249 [Kineothrix alysoides]|uniref:Uncharacterized protein n=1 Tax=Kineothrix alysoides TaxID=1469948 RepID=A0A4R1R765_9FIRM|nr:hypothetical protein [Kineothrix alysoides]TCL61152.1 hypothetical protein EDD76_101249 [Kineothrix alysoides]
MEIVKSLMKIALNFILWIWSHCPIMSLSNDDNFATLEIEEMRQAHLRISVLNIMLGDRIVYILSYDIKEERFSVIKLLHLTDIEGNLLKNEKIAEIQERFRNHIAEITDEDLEIEKEKLLYHIEHEEQRISSSVDKINIYATIILTVIPIVLAIIDFATLKEISVILQIMVCIAIYALLNVCIFIFRTIKVRGINKSSFADLRSSEKRSSEIVVQYQYDWQQVKYKAQLFVSIVLNLQEWVILLLILTIGISFGATIQINDESNKVLSESESIVITVNKNEISVPYSDSAIDWQSMVYEIEKKECTHIIVLLNDDEVPTEIEELDKYKDLDIEVLTDKEIDKSMMKVVEVR